MNPIEDGRRARQEGGEGRTVTIVDYIGPDNALNKDKPIRVMSDDTWRSRWKLPDSERVRWDRLPTMERAMSQLDVVIDSYLGTPLNVQLTNGIPTTINLGVSIPELADRLDEMTEEDSDSELKPLRTIIVPGELALINELTAMIQDALPRIASRDLEPQEERDLLKQIGERIGRVRNPEKAEAKFLLTRDDLDSDPMKDALKAYGTLLKRSADGAAIVSSLFDRGGYILEWDRRQNTRLSRIRIPLERAVIDIDDGKLDDNRRAEWARYFGSGEEGPMMTELNELHGAPYGAFRTNPDIIRLSNHPEILLYGNQRELLALVGKAALPFEKHQMQRINDIRTGRYKRYKTPDLITHDNDVLESYEALKRAKTSY